MANVCLAEPATADAHHIIDKPLGIFTVLAVCILFIAGMKGLTYREPAGRPVDLRRNRP